MYKLYSYIRYMRTEQTGNQDYVCVLVTYWFSMIFLWSYMVIRVIGGLKSPWYPVFFSEKRDLKTWSLEKKRRKLDLGSLYPQEMIGIGNLHAPCPTWRIRVIKWLIYNHG